LGKISKTFNGNLILQNILQPIIKKELSKKTKEFRRIFHGRGNFYGKFNFLNIDSINDTFFVSIYKENEDQLELINFLKNIAIEYNYNNFIVQKRYIKNAPCEVIFGKIGDNQIAIENGLKYFINFNNKNIGFFPDMKKGREYIQSICKDKNVLNLFSYTCSFSVVAIDAGAKQVVNVDMSKNSLNIGKQNHKLNDLDIRKVKFLPFNILKSWSKIRKFAPYDIIIIDPPSFQRGSFEATNDYRKIVKKLDQLSNGNCIVLSCLNAPELNCDFLIKLFNEEANSFKFVKRLTNLETFISKDEEKSLKNLIFKKVINSN